MTDLIRLIFFSIFQIEESGDQGNLLNVILKGEKSVDGGIIQGVHQGGEELRVFSLKIRKLLSFFNLVIS